MSDTQLQLNSNELRIVLDDLYRYTNRSMMIATIERDVEVLLQQEHLSCKIMLLGDDYVEKAIESFRNVSKLTGEFKELRRFNETKTCFEYISTQNKELKTITVQGVTKTLVFTNLSERFSVLGGRFFDKTKLREFLRARYSYAFTIVVVGDTIECSRVRFSWNQLEAYCSPRPVQVFNPGF